jgi:hypothetical protein
MTKLDECVSEILCVERKDGPDAISLATQRAHEFLAASGGGVASFSLGEGRERLIAELRQKGAKTRLLDQIIEAIGHLS